MLKVKILWGTHRADTFGENPAKLALSVAERMPEWEVELLDLRKLNIPDEIASLTPSQANGVYTNETVQAWGKTIAEADAFIIVTTEYNHGYPAILKNALDHLYPEWHRKPVAFVGYGGELGAGRAIEQLRQVMVEFHVASIRDAVYIPFVWEAFNADGTPVNEKLIPRLEAMYQDLSWWGKALQAARNKSE